MRPIEPDCYIRMTKNILHLNFKNTQVHGWESLYTEYRYIRHHNKRLRL